MPDDKYILVDCKCGRRIRALIAELNKGIICPRCNSHIGRDTLAKENAVEQAENISEEIPADAVFEKCPSCSVNVKINYRKKYLAQCQACSVFFLRKKKPDTDSTVNVGKTENFIKPRWISRVN